MSKAAVGSISAATGIKLRVPVGGTNRIDSSGITGALDVALGVSFCVLLSGPYRVDDTRVTCVLDAAAGGTEQADDIGTLGPSCIAASPLAISCMYLVQGRFQKFLVGGDGHHGTDAY